MPTHAPMTHATSTLPDSRSQDFRASRPTFAMCTVSATCLLVWFRGWFCIDNSSGIPCCWSSRFCLALAIPEGERTAGQIGALPGSVRLLRHTTRPVRGRKWSRLRSPALLCRFVCSLIEAGSEFQPRYSARSTRAPGSPPATVFCACVRMSVRPPKGASGTVQSRAFAPEATLCVKNVKQSKVRWMRAVLASRTELVCAPNATAVVPDCDTGHEGEFLIYANYGE